MVSSVNSHTDATRIGWHLWEIDLIFVPGLPPGWGARMTSLVAPAESVSPSGGVRGIQKILSLEGL